MLLQISGLVVSCADEISTKLSILEGVLEFRSDKSLLKLLTSVVGLKFSQLLEESISVSVGSASEETKEEFII